MKQQLAQAISLASTCHMNQFDKRGMPYILHPIAVMQGLHTDDQELMAIAVLHDVVEDCNITFSQLSLTGFSDRIVRGVQGMTKTPGETVNQNLRRMMLNMDVVDVKISDLNHNMQLGRLKGVSEKDLARMNKYIYMYNILNLFKHGALVDSDWDSKYGPTLSEAL